MPRVPRRNPNPLNTAPLARERTPIVSPRTAVETPNLGPLSASVNRFIEQERQRADTVVLLDADNRLARLETDLRVRASQRRGKDALNVTSEIEADWQKGIAEIEQSLTNTRQQENFRARVASRFTDLYGALERHTANELARYEEETTKTALALRVNDALANYTDPNAVAKAAVEARAIVEDEARRNGWSDEVRDARVLEQLSQIHSGVVARMLDAGDDQAARAWYEKAKSQITGVDQAKLAPALEEGSTRGESARQTAEIVASAADRGAALARVDEIADVDVRDETRRRVNQHYNEQKVVEQERLETAYQAARERVTQNMGRHPREIVPPATWRALSDEKRATLVRISEGADRPNNDKKWLTFLDLDPRALGAMTQSEFESKHWSFFDASHRRQAEAMWAAARDAFRTGKMEKVVNVMAFDRRVSDALVRNRFVPGDKPRTKWDDEELELFATFREEASSRVEHATAAKGKPLSGDEMQAIIDRLVIERALEQKPLSRRNLDDEDDVPATAMLTIDRTGNYRVRTERIPPDSRNALADALRRAGLTVSTDKIERLYAAQLLGVSQDDFNAIAREP